MADLIAIRNHILTRLKNELPASLTYHNVDHTIDVETQCMAIAAGEGVTDEQTLLELRLAALYHDSGFLFAYRGHEEESCKLAKKELPGFGISDKSVNNICEIILSTKIPQSPKNLVQKIICDADLDHLGRNDYYIINEKLHHEFIMYGIICSEEEWKNSKISFLTAHSYFTEYSKVTRKEKKLAHLQSLLKAGE